MLGFHTKRCKRTAILVADGKAELVLVAEEALTLPFFPCPPPPPPTLNLLALVAKANDDPAGDDRPQNACIESVLEKMKK